MRKIKLLFLILIITTAVFTPLLSKAVGETTTVTQSTVKNDSDQGIIDTISNTETAQLAKKAISTAANNLDTAVTCATNPIKCAQLVLLFLIQTAGNLILSAVSWLLWLAGSLFNFSIIVFVINMKTFIDKVGVIYVVWQTARDMANMFFIFILLYIAIQTILQLGNYKPLLIKVILVALFINFSFFLTGLVIDTSNIVALQFYKSFASDKDNTDGGMSYKIVQSLKIQTIYATPESPKTVGGAVASVADAALFIPTIQLTAMKAVFKFVIAIVLGSTLMIILSATFIASAVIIFHRFIELTIALMFSPLAFVAMILPGTSDYYKRWKKILIPQVIFAPVYFMFLWFSMKIITSGQLATSLNVNKDIGFYSLFNGDSQVEAFGLIANYIIVIMLLNMSIILAKELGGAGADVAAKVYGGITNFVRKNTVGRVGQTAQFTAAHTIGRAASTVANSSTLRNFRINNPVLGKLAQKPFENLADYGFGVKKGGYKTRVETEVKENEAFAKKLGPTPEETKEAEDKLKDVKEKQRKLTMGIEKGFENNEIRLTTELNKKSEERATKEKEYNEKLKAAEADVKGATEAYAKAGYFDKTKAKEDLIKKEKSLKELDAQKIELENIKKEEGVLLQNKKDLNNQRKTAISNAMAPLNQDRIAYQEAVDKLKGLDADEIKKRAKNKVEEQALRGGWSDDKERVARTIENVTKELTDSYKGALRENQEKFIESLETGYGDLFARLVPKPMKNNVRDAVNIIITDPKARLQNGNAIRALWGKTKKDKIYEELMKQVKEDTGEKEPEPVKDAPKPKV